MFQAGMGVEDVNGPMAFGADAGAGTNIGNGGGEVADVTNGLLLNAAYLYGNTPALLLTGKLFGVHMLGIALGSLEM